MAASPNSTPTKYVSKAIIRREFNNGKYWERAKEGEFTVELKDDRHPRIPFEPYCTRSQYVVYYDSNGKFVAGAHQYLRPDGTIGGRGKKPDPKRLMVAGELWTVRTRKPKARKAGA